MKDLRTIINEANNSLFSNKVKYSKSDWEKWKNTANDDVLVGNYEDDKDLELVYIINHKDKKIDHIATYNTKTEILWTDDIELFGHEV